MLVSTKICFLLILHVHLGSVGNSPLYGHSGPGYGYITSTKVPKVTKAGQEHRVFMLPLTSGPKSSGMAMPIFRKGSEAILPSAQDMNTQNTIWQAAIMTAKVYLLNTKYLAHSLSCKQNVFMLYHSHQKEKTQGLSWSYLRPINLKNLQVYGCA